MQGGVPEVGRLLHLVEGPVLDGVSGNRLPGQESRPVRCCDRFFYFTGFTSSSSNACLVSHTGTCTLDCQWVGGKMNS